MMPKYSACTFQAFTEQDVEHAGGRPLVEMVAAAGDQMLDELARLQVPSSLPPQASQIEQLAASILKGDGIDNAVRATAIRPLLVSSAD